MASERVNNIKLGLFVLAATIVLVLALYLLGLKRDLFSRTMDVSARFNEVSGLRTGNNVRYAGIDVGTVERITIVNDTQVVVDMMIRRDAATHMRTSAVARIASDGLMGNQIVNVEPGDGPGGPLVDGTDLRTIRGLDTDAMLRSLSRSNDNVVAITTDLRGLSRRLNSDRGLLTLLDDSGLVVDMRSAVYEIRIAATNARTLTDRVNEVVRDLQAGKGALGALITDRATERQVRDLVDNLQHVSDSLALVSDRFGRFSQGLDRPGGLAHAITRDTVLVTDMKRVVANLDTSSATLSEDLRALQHNWFFRHYFKEKEQEEKKKKKEKQKGTVDP